MSVVLPPDVLATGDSAVGIQRRFSFVAPSDTWIVEAIFGFFIDYCTAGTWFQVGTATPDEAAEIFQRIYYSLGVDLATIGAIVPYAGGILPLGWLVADGSSLLRVDYPDLFAAIGTVWGAADGTHFNIPDLRGQTLVGQGDSRSGSTFSLGDVGGLESVGLTTAEMPAHTHSVNPHTHGYIGAGPNVTTVGPGAPQPTAIPAPFVSAPDVLTGTGSTGGGNPHTNLQPYAVVNYAIIAL